jgi:phosphoribosylformylglycinamidine cyclo-ligase
VPGRADDKELTYRSAGVDIEAGEEAVDLIKKDVESTYIPGVMGSLGGFAGIFEMPKNMRNPVLVTGTDGVGTKLLLAQEMGRLDTVGIDLVAMSVNDVLTVGARPVLFLDYIAVGKLVPAEMAQIVAGVAEGCRQAGCALVGGEMAEMPGLYTPGEFDVAGFCVAIAERDELIDGSAIAEGDQVIGLPSSGFHSNGYSLVRKVVAASGLNLRDTPEGLERPIGELLMEPTRIYVKTVLALLEAGIPIKGMAHITGGGMTGNLSRVIPDRLQARLKEWPVPPLFRTMQRLGGIADDEMYRAFNMGVGLVMVVSAEAVDEAMERLAEAGETPIRLGEIVKAQPGMTDAAKVTLWASA